MADDPFTKPCVLQNPAGAVPNLVRDDNSSREGTYGAFHKTHISVKYDGLDALIGKERLDIAYKDKIVRQNQFAHGIPGLTVRPATPDAA
jgi:hypothetical protein